MSTIIYPSPIFGPVNSRRLGVSLGINLMPSDGKVCSFDCVYCECGFNADFRPKKKRPTREEVREGLEKVLKEHHDNNQPLDAIGAFLLEHDMTVYLVIFDRSAYQISSRLFADIAAYIDDHYVDAHTDFIRSRPYSDSITDEDVRPTCRAPSVAFPSVPRPLRSLNDRLRHLDAGFSETLLTRIDRSGKKDSEIYKRANVDRKLFSKIRSNPDYRPSKPTALAFAIALELDLNETRDLIARAGYALSRSSKFDVIIEYFISQRNYNIYEINEALFAFDQSLLGA